MEGGKGMEGTPRRRGQREGATAAPGPVRFGSAERGAAALCSPRQPAPLRASPRLSAPAPLPARPGGAGTCVRWPRCLRAAAPLRRVRRSGAARLAAPSGRKRAPFSQTKHPAALSPALLLPAPGPWLCSSAAAFPPGKVGEGSDSGPGVAQPGFWGIWARQQAPAGGNPRERGLAGTWETRDLSALLCLPPKEQSRHGAAPSQLEDKVRPGRWAGEMNRATFPPALGFIALKAGAFSPAGERVHDSNMSLLSHPHLL